MLKINLEKSELIVVREILNMEELVEILVCKVGILPSTYLCFPSSMLYKSSRVWKRVEERFQKRLLHGNDSISQKAKGKISLIAPYQVYGSIVYNPYKVATRLEKIRRDFL